MQNLRYTTGMTLSNPYFGIMQPSSAGMGTLMGGNINLSQPVKNAMYTGRYGAGGKTPPVLSYNPLFGRPGWTYVKLNYAPRLGPGPKLAQGTGRTASGPEYNPLLGGFASTTDYQPQGMAYAPRWSENSEFKPPRSIQVGDDGIELMGTYRAHDFTPADRFVAHTRSAPNWQEMTYPPDYRNLLAWKQVEKYMVGSRTNSARILPQSSYFLGYQTNPIIAANIGQTGLGYMGSV